MVDDVSAPESAPQLLPAIEIINLETIEADVVKLAHDVVAEVEKEIG